MPGIARQLRRPRHRQVLTTATDPALPADDEVDGIPLTRVFVRRPQRASRRRGPVPDGYRSPADGRRADIVHLARLLDEERHRHRHRERCPQADRDEPPHIGFDEPAAIGRQGRLARWAFLSGRSLSQRQSRAWWTRIWPPACPLTRIQLVPNGIDIDRLHPCHDEERRELRARLSLPGDRPVIAFVGFFSTDKQPRVLFDAWLRLHRAGRVAAAVAIRRRDPIALF